MAQIISSPQFGKKKKKKKNLSLTDLDITKILGSLKDLQRNH